MHWTHNANLTPRLLFCIAKMATFLALLLERYNTLANETLTDRPGNGLKVLAYWNLVSLLLFRILTLPCKESFAILLEDGRSHGRELSHHSWVLNFEQPMASALDHPTWRFLSLPVMHILSQMILYCSFCLMYYRIFSSISGLYPLSPNKSPQLWQLKMYPDISKYSLVVVVVVMGKSHP